LFKSIKLLIEEARKQVVGNETTIMTFSYFEIVRRIIEHEQEARKEQSDSIRYPSGKKGKYCL